MITFKDISEGISEKKNKEISLEMPEKSVGEIPGRNLWEISEESSERTADWISGGFPEGISKNIPEKCSGISPRNPFEVPSLFLCGFVAGTSPDF